MTSTTTKLAAAAALAAAALALNTVSASAKTCWPYGTIAGNEGTAYKIANAKQNARIKWRIRVRGSATAGMGWTDWGLAANRSYSCRKKNGRHRCRAVATPCKA
ncbi:MAG: hypothetical protein AAF441_00150 [Pseudomonadota bacterium]